MSDPWTLPQASPAFGSRPEPDQVTFGEPAAPHVGDMPPDIATHFPHGSEAGWRPDPNVEGQLRLWDGRHWTEHVRPLDPVAEAWKAAPPVRGNEGVRAWALIAQLMLSLKVLASCVALLWAIATLNGISIWSMQPGALHEGLARSLLESMVLIGLGLILVWSFSAVFLLIWIGVARQDRHMNRQLLRGSLVGTVIGWFVPVVRIRIAWRTLTDLYQASDPRRAGHGPTTASRAAPPLVMTHCALVLVRGSTIFFPGILIWLGVTRISEALGTVDTLRDAMFILIGVTALDVAATVCLILIITRVTDHLRGRAPAPGTETAKKPMGAQFTRL
jgi:Protein of unknown function (DUF2510)/Domain of unknown function (DUF4328)